jgi:hypothetical protein
MLTQIYQRYNNAHQYIEKYKDKIKWINDFYAEVIVNVEEKNSYYNMIQPLLNSNPNLLEYIQAEFINKID